MTIEAMKALVQKHSEAETRLDLDAVMATLVDHPVYEFFPEGLRLEGVEHVREFYTEHFNSFFPLIESFVLVNETWGEHSACLEYDVTLKAPHSRDSAFRICVVLTAKDSRLIGERFYVDNELAQLMAGSSYRKFMKC